VPLRNIVNVPAVTPSAGEVRFFISHRVQKPLSEAIERHLRELFAEVA